MKAFYFIMVLFLLPCFDTELMAAPTEFYELRIYQIDTPEQEKVVDEYLQQAYLPALHRYGIAKVGVFKPGRTRHGILWKTNLCAHPVSDPGKFLTMPEALQKDKKFQEAGKKYIDAPYKAPPMRASSLLS